MDVLLLSRIQFGLTIAFHYIFPPMSIGLSIILIVMEGMYLKTKNELYHQMTRFWVKIFGLIFALGVATGIVMEFQFGTNWASYSRYVGDVFGSALAAEGIFAFFLESGFLAILLFGWNKVKPRTHFISTIMVSFGAHFSAVWIVVANSWQQTPAGYVIQNGRAELTGFREAVFNPSTLLRFFHTVDATLITGAFFMAGISAYFLLKNKENEAAAKSIRLALIFGAVASILELYPFGHEHTRQVAHTQPEKFATIEAVFETTAEAPLVLFGIPREEPPELLLRIEIPYLLSLLVDNDIHATVQGMDSFPQDELPPFFLTFVTFHNMVALGMFFIFVMVWGVIKLYRKTLFESRVYLKLLIWSIPLPLIACQLGWITAEVGRQPWIVYGLLKTKDAFSPTVSAGEVLFSIILFSFIYLFLGLLYIYLLIREIRRGLEPVTAKEVTA